MQETNPSPFSAELLAVGRDAVSRTVSGMNQRSPQLSAPVFKWLATYCDLDRPEEYFLHPSALPMLSLPWWLEQSLRGTVDPAFQSRLMGASASLYCFARMLDDLMDDHPTEKTALPALYLFLLDFQGMLFEDFSSSHGFWTHFRRYMNEMPEVTSVELTLTEMDEQAFKNIAARKPVGALVPVAAVCCRYGREDALAAWEDFFRIFAYWHQFRDDLLDWNEDAERGTRTWLLYEAERRKLPGESLAMWMGREGFAWAGERLAQWMAEMKQKAAVLNSPELLQYLDLREQLCTTEVGFMAQSAAIWARLLESAPANG